MAHTDIVSDHMSHCASQQMWLVDVCLHTDADRFVCTHRIRCSHANLTTGKCFTATENESVLNHYSRIGYKNGIQNWSILFVRDIL